MAKSPINSLFAESDTAAEADASVPKAVLPPWKVLIVDDDKEVHELTKLILHPFRFEGRKIDFLSAFSGRESLALLQQHEDIALVLLDVVMETDHAGLDVARQIRETLDNQLIRIILRTGQPGQAPEEQVVIDYDINDYKDKSDLTASKLKTMTIAALRGYRDLHRLASNRQSLMKVADASTALFHLHSLHSFALDILLKLSSLWPLGAKPLATERATTVIPASAIQTSGWVANECNGQFRIVAGVGQYAPLQTQALDEIIPEQTMLNVQQVNQSRQPLFLPEYSLLFISASSRKHSFIIYLENCPVVDEWERQLIQLLCTNISTAYDNVGLLSSLEKLNQSLESKVQQRTAELEKAKVAAEAATHAKSLFLANISHEIRTPLNAILGFAQLSLRTPNIPKAQSDMLHAIEKAGNHLLEVINEVLELSKIEAGGMEIDASDFYLSQLVDDIVSMFSLRCEQKGLLWQLDSNIQASKVVRGDAAKLRQVLINLLGNAVKFTEHGSVQLRVTQKTEHRFLFEVSDTGPGISPQEQAAIFDAFYQANTDRHTTGTGLGLSISRRQIELMGGRLELQSQLGQGSRFFFQIVLPDASQEALPRSPPDRRIMGLKAGTRLSALVVDDVKENRIMLSSLLHDLGIEVRSAENGLEALSCLRQHRDDIVFMDIRMPVMNGDEAVAQIRREFQHEPIICVAISAYSMAHEVEYYLSAGFDRYIPKPFQFETIYQTLQELCGVEFEYEAIDSPDEVPGKDKTELDFSHVVLPETLYTALMEAAELNRMTHIRQLLDEVEAVKAGGVELSAHLYGLLVNYDTQGIVETLQRVAHGDAH